VQCRVNKGIQARYQVVTIIFATRRDLIRSMSVAYATVRVSRDKENKMFEQLLEQYLSANNNYDSNPAAYDEVVAAIYANGFVESEFYDYAELNGLFD
jgi:hypothetical protein